MRVLMATDGSPDAAHARQWLLHLPLPPDTAVSVICALPATDLYDEVVPYGARRLREHAEGLVDEACRQLGGRWANVTGRVREGDPRDVIVDAATEEDTDLIVLGARGLGAVGTALLGSVSLAVARMAPCAVLIAKGLPRPLGAVAVGLDGSEYATAALRFLGDWPLPRSLAVHLVAVVEPLRYPATAPGSIASPLRAAIRHHEETRRQELSEVLARAADALGGRVERVSTTTLVGRPGPALLDEVERNASDLIVVGARGLGVVKRLLLGSVSEHVLRHAACPVLIVRPRGGDAR